MKSSNSPKLHEAECQLIFKTEDAAEAHLHKVRKEKTSIPPPMKPTIPPTNPRRLSTQPNTPTDRPNQPNQKHFGTIRPEYGLPRGQEVSTRNNSPNDTSPNG